MLRHDPEKPVPDLSRNGRRFSPTNDFVGPEIMPANKSGDESPMHIFYRSYVTLRSIRRAGPGKLRC